MKKRIIKLAKGLNKFTFNEVQIMAEVEESELRQVLKELITENALKEFSKDNFLYISTSYNTSQPVKSKKDKVVEHTIISLKAENIKGYSEYQNATGKQREYADKYFKLIQACGNLKGSKLQNFIDKKWNKMFPEYKTSYTSFMGVKKKFNQTGFYSLLPVWNYSNKGKSCILDELYSFFIDEYFSFESPPLTEAARRAKKRFIELNPDIEICQLPADSTFAKRLKREYTKEEISTFRNFAIKNKFREVEKIKKLR